MRLNLFVDLIYRQINGGRPSTDSSVTKNQIKALLPAAVNYALTGDYWANIRMEGDREVPGAFITELEARTFKTDDLGKEYIELPESLANIGGNGGVRYVRDGGENHYSPRPQGTSPSHWDGILLGLREFQHTKRRLYLYNRNCLVDMFFIGVILDVSEMKDTDDLPIPAGREPEVIDIVRAFFRDQRLSPKDYIVNGVDPLNSETNV